MRPRAMRMEVIAGTVFTVLAFTTTGPALAADDTKVKGATEQVEHGAKGVGEGVKDTAKGVGHTVSEGAKYTGEKLKESGQAAEPEARSAWDHVKGGAQDFGHSVKNFFTSLFH